MFLAFMSRMSFGMALMNALLKIGIVAIFLPFSLFLWLFETTKRHSVASSPNKIHRV